MDLNELQSVRDRERQTDKLQQLRESFYADAGSFIRQLRAERDRAVERAEEPFDSAEVRQLSDEIKTAERTVEAIYEKRVGKIVKAASFAAADLPAEVDGMTAEEQALFGSLVADIEDNRQQVLDLLDGDEGDPGGPDTAADTGASTATQEPTGSTHARDSTQGNPAPDDTEPSGDAAGGPPSDADPGDDVTAADVMSDTGESADRTPDSDGAASPQETNDPPPSSEPLDPQVRKDGGEDATADDVDAAPAGQEPDDAEVDRQRVQILDDVDTFLGFDDRDYDLEPDDVVSLPATNADILLDRGVAREL